MNHSKRFIRGFVDIMIKVMERMISEHFKEIDPVTCRKRILAFMADKMTELHRTRDGVDLMFIIEEGEIRSIFIDY
jgi:hypothetical protein